MTGEITQLLQSASDGNRASLDAVMPLIYDALAKTARHQLRGERAGHTLSTGALINETYLRLSDQAKSDWESRAHFLAVASIVMRRVLVDHAKHRNRAKRGSGEEPVTLEHALDVAAEEAGLDIEALDSALGRLADFDERAARVVECRYFGGLSIEEAAEALNIAPATVKRDWLVAKAWLKRELAED